MVAARTIVVLAALTVTLLGETALSAQLKQKHHQRLRHGAAVQNQSPVEAIDDDQDENDVGDDTIDAGAAQADVAVASAEPTEDVAKTVTNAVVSDDPTAATDEQGAAAADSEGDDPWPTGSETAPSSAAAVDATATDASPQHASAAAAPEGDASAADADPAVATTGGVAASAEAAAAPAAPARKPMAAGAPQSAAVPPGETAVNTAVTVTPPAATAGSNSDAHNEEDGDDDPKFAGDPAPASVASNVALSDTDAIVSDAAAEHDAAQRVVENAEAQADDEGKTDTKKAVAVNTKMQANANVEARTDKTKAQADESEMDTDKVATDKTKGDATTEDVADENGQADTNEEKVMKSDAEKETDTKQVAHEDTATESAENATTAQVTTKVDVAQDENATETQDADAIEKQVMQEMQQQQQQPPPQQQQQQATVDAEKSHIEDTKAAGAEAEAEHVAEELNPQITVSEGQKDAGPIKAVAVGGKQDINNATADTAKAAITASRSDSTGKSSKAMTADDDIDLDDEGAESEQEAAVMSQAMKPLGSAQEEEYDSVAKAVEEDSKRSETLRPNGFVGGDEALIQRKAVRQAATPHDSH